MILLSGFSSSDETSKLIGIFGSHLNLLISEKKLRGETADDGFGGGEALQGNTYHKLGKPHSIWTTLEICSVAYVVCVCVLMRSFAYVNCMCTMGGHVQVSAQSAS